MRKLPSIFQHLLVLAACLLLAACFDIREEVWIEQDGTGRAELRYTVPESALLLGGGAAGIEQKIRDLIAKQPSLVLDAVSIDVKEDRATVVVKVSTESIISLRKLKKNDSLKSLSPSTADIAGHFDVRFSWVDLDLDFSRSIKVRDALGLASLAVGSSERENRRLTYIIHLPKPAKENNATQVTDAGKTLTWDYTLGEAMSKPVVTRFRATVPIPASVWLAVAGGLIAIAGIAVWTVKKLRRLSRRDTSTP